MTELPLEEWHDFYLTIGAGAAAILGATFVVATLTADVKERNLGLRGFITPTAVHLGSVLTASVILTMPTLNLWELIAVFGLGGLGGIVYCGIVWRRIMVLKIDMVDRFWYAIAPFLAYAALVAGAVLAWRENVFAFELIGIAMVFLLVAGVRNAWDMATFLITRDPPNSGSS